METKLKIFFKTKEEVDSTEATSTTTFSSSMTTSGVDTRKYIKISRTLEKRVSPGAMSEVRMLTPKSKTGYGTSVFICEEEKLIHKIPGKIKKKKEVIMEDKGTEITPSLIRMAMKEREKERMREREREREREKEREEKEKKEREEKEKEKEREREKRRSREESVFSKYQRQYSPSIRPKLSTASRKNNLVSNLYLTLYDEVQQGTLFLPDLEGLHKACEIFSHIRSGKIYVNDVPPMLRALKISISDGEMRQALKSVYIDVNGLLDFSEFIMILNDKGTFSQDPAFQEAFQIFSKIKGGRVEVDNVLPILNILGISVSFSTYQEVMDYLVHDASRMVDFGDFLFSLEDLQQQYEDIVLMDRSSQDEMDRKSSKARGSRLYQQLRKKSSMMPKTPEPSPTPRPSKKNIMNERMTGNFNFLSPRQSLRSNLSFKKTLERIDISVLESLRTSSKTSISFRKLIGQTETYKLEAPPPKVFPSYRRPFHDADLSSIFESQQKVIKIEQSYNRESVRSSLRKSVEEPEKYEICVTGTQPRVSEAAVRKLPEAEEIPTARKSSSFLKYVEEPDQKHGISVTDLQVPSVKASQMLRKPLSEVHIPSAPQVSLALEKFQPEKAKEISVLGGDMRALEIVSDVKEAFGFVSKLKEDMVPLGELRSMLKTLGMDLSDEEFETVLKMTPLDEDGLVNLKEFVVNLVKTRQFSEYSVLKEAINVIEGFEDENVDMADLKSKLKKLGIFCTKEEFDRALEQVPADSQGRVNFKNFVNTLMSDPGFGKGSFIDESLYKVEQVSVNNLWETLHTIDPNLTEEDFQEALKEVSKDENENVNVDEFFKALEDVRQQSLDLLGLSDSILALNMIQDNVIDKEDLEYVLKNLGVILAEDELKKLLASTDDNVVNIKDILSILRRTNSFSNFIALKETMEQDISIPLAPEDIYKDILQRKFPQEITEMQLTDQEIQDRIGAPLLEGSEKDKFNTFMKALSRSQKFPLKDAVKKGIDAFTRLEGDKISIPDLQDALTNLNINLPKENLNRIFESCASDEKGDIQLKDFIGGLTQASQLTDSIALQLVSSTLQSIHDDLIDLDELKDSLIQRDLYGANEVLGQVIPMVSINEKGKVDVNEFIGILSRVLLVPDAAGVKELLNEINIAKTDENIIPQLQEMMRLRGIHLNADKIEEALNTTTVGEDGIVNLKNFATTVSTLKRFDECQKIEDAWNTVNKVFDGSVMIDDLPLALEKMGVKLTFENLKEVLESIKLEEDGSIKIKDVVKKLLMTKFFQGDDVARRRALKWTLKQKLQDAWIVVTSVSEGRVKPCDLKPTLESLGLDLSEEEIKEILKFTETNEDGTVNLDEVINKLTKYQKLTTNQRMQHAYNVITNVKDGQVQMSDLTSTVEGLGFDLNEEEIKEVLKTVKADENEKVDFKDLVKELTVVDKLHKTERLEKARVVAASVNEGKVNVSDLAPTLKSLGISLNDSQVKEMMKTIEVDESEMVNLKDIAKKLAEEKSQKVQSLQNAAHIFTNVTDGQVKITDLSSTMKSLGVSLTEKDIEETLKSLEAEGSETVNLEKFVKTIPKTKISPKIKQIQNVTDVVSHITDGKVNIEDLKPTLETLGIELKEEELKEVLRSTQPDEEGRVNLKEAVKNVTESIKLASTQRIQNACNIITNVTDGKVSMENLPSTLESLGIDVSDEDLQETLKSVERDGEGKVEFKDAVTKLVEAQNKKKTERITAAANIISTITEKKIKVDDLPSKLVSLGFRLSQEEIQEALKSIEPDEEGKIKFEDFTEKMMMTESFVKSDRIQKACDVVSNIIDGKVSIADVMPTLQNLGIELSKEKFTETIKTILPDEEGKVDFQEVAQKLIASKHALKGQQIENVRTVVTNITDGKIILEDLTPTIESLGIVCTDEALQETLKEIAPDDEGKVDFKDVMKQIIKRKKSITAQQIQKAQTVVSAISGGMVHVDNLTPTLETLGVKLKDEVIKETLESVGTDDEGIVNLSNFVKTLSLTEIITKEDKKVLDTVTKITDGKLKIDDVSSTLKNLGVKLAEEDLKETLKTVEIEDGMVNLKTLVDKLATVEDFSEYKRLEEACNVVSNISDGKVKVEDLTTTLQHLGVKIADDHIKETLKMVTADGEGAVNLKEFVDSLAKTEEFNDLRRIENACKLVSSTKEGKVKIDDLTPTLEILGVDLTADEIKETLESVKPDEDGTMDLKHFFKKLTKMEKYNKCQRLKEACDVTKSSDGKVKVSQLSSTMKSLGIPLNHDELNEALKHVEVDENGEVNLKNFMDVLTKTENYLAPQRLENVCEVISNVTSGKVKVDGLASTLEGLGIKIANEEINEVLQTVQRDADGAVNLKSFVDSWAKNEQLKEEKRLEAASNIVTSITDGKVKADDLKSTLETLGVKLTEKELQETLDTIKVDENEAVNLKTFMETLAETQQLHETQRLETACNVVTGVTDGKISLDDLSDTLKSLLLEPTEEELQEALKTVTPDENNKVHLKTLIDNLAKKQTFDEINRIENACNLVSNVTDGKVKVTKLSSVLDGLGVKLTFDQLKDTLKIVGNDENDMVDLEEFIKELSKSEQSNTYKYIEDVCEAVNTISEGKVKMDDLPSTLKNLGIQMTEEEFKETLTSMGVEGAEAVDLPQFIDISIKNKKKKSLVIEDTFKKISKITGGKVKVYNVPDTLEGLRFSLSDEQIKDFIQSLQADEQGDVDLRKFVKKMSSKGKIRKKDKKPLKESFLKEKFHDAVGKKMPLKQKIARWGKIDGGLSFQEGEWEGLGIYDPNMKRRDAKNRFSVVIGIQSWEIDIYQQLPKILGADLCNLSLTDYKWAAIVQKYGHSALDDLTLNKDRMIHASALKDLLEDLNISLSPELIKDVMQRVSIDESGNISLRETLLALNSLQRFSDLKAREQMIGALSKVTDKEIDINDLEPILQGIGLKTSPKELQEVIKQLPVSENGKVNLKQCIAALTRTEFFTKGSEIEQPLSILASIRNNSVPVESIDSVIKTMGIHLTSEELDDILKNMPLKDGMKVDLQMFLETVSKMKSSEQDEKRMVEVENLPSLLESMGMHLPPEEIQKALKFVAVNDDGKVNMNKFLNSVHFNQKYSQLKGDRVSFKKLRAFLNTLGIHLTEKETQKILKHVPMDDNGYVNKKEFMVYMVNTRSSAQFEKNKVDVEKLEFLLGLMGIHLSDEEIQDVVHHIPVKDEKVNIKKFINAVQDIKKIPLYEGMKIDVQNLNNVLGSMKVNITDEELQELLKDLSVAEDGSIDLDKVMEIVRSHQTQTYDDDIINSSQLDAVLKNMGIYLSEKELQELIKHQKETPDGKIELDKVIDSLKTFKGGMIDAKRVEDVLDKMGITLTEKELQEILKEVPTDENGMVELSKLTNTLKNKKGMKVDINNLDGILGNMGLELTNEEFQNLLKEIPVDYHGNVDLNKLMDSVKSMKGGKVDINNLDNFLGTMGVELTEEEQQELLKKIPVSADGKIDLSKLEDTLKAIKEDKLDVNNMDTFLGNMGIEITKEQLEELKQQLTVDAHGQVSQKKLMEALKKSKGGKMDASNLDSILENMGIKFTNEELKEMLKQLPMDADGKVEMSKLMESIQAVKGEKIDVQNLDNILGNMGIEFTDKEIKEFMKYLPIDSEGNMFQSDLISAIQTFKGGKVDVHNLDSVLENMGVKLTDEELQEILRYMPVDANGKMDISNLLNEVKAIKGEKVDVTNMDDFLKKAGIELSDQEFQELMKNLPIDASGKVALSKLMDNLQASKEAKIDVNNLEDFLNNMGIKITEEEFRELKKNLPVDGDGKIDLSTMLNEMKGYKEEHDISNVENVLRSMGMEFTEKELWELRKNLPVDANGKVNQKSLMNAVKVLNGGNADINNLEQILRNLGFKLTDKEFEELLTNLPVDDNGKVSMKNVWDKVKAIKENIDVENLDNFLKNLGIILTEEEEEELLKHLPIDANGKVNEKIIKNAVKSLNRGSVDVNNLDRLLGNLGFKLTDTEFKELLTNLPVNDDGRVTLHDVMDKVKTLRENIDVKNLSNVLEEMGIILTEEEHQKLLKKLPIDDSGKVNQKNLVNALKTFHGGNIDIKDLDQVLGNLGIKLTDKEIEELITKLPVDDNGKVSMKKVMDKVKTIKEKIDIENLDNFLKDMGITFTEREYQDLLRRLSIDANGKVSQRNLMNGLKTLNKGNVDVNKLDQFLGNLGIKLTDKETEELLSNLPVDDDGQVAMNKVLEKVKAMKEKVDVENLDNFLKDMGLTLTEEEQQDLLKHLPVDANGKVNQKSLMNAMKTLNKGNVDVNNLDQFLGNLGIELTDKEIEDLLSNLPVDDDGKVSMNKILDKVKAIKESVDVENVDNFLKDMGIILTKEQQELLKYLPLDGSGKIEKNKLMNQLMSLKGGKVDIHDLDNVLENLGMDLTDQQLQELLTALPLDPDGKVDLTKLLQVSKSIKDGVTSLMSASSDFKLKYKLKPLTKIPASHGRGKGYFQDHGKSRERLTQAQLEAFLDAFECFDKDETGCIDTHGLQCTVARFGIDLTNQEIQDELDYADIDRDGKVNFSDFLTVLTDDERFIQAVVPETDPNSDLVDSTGILLFEILSKLVETSALSRKSMVDIVCYYRKKYHDTANKPLWRRYEAGISGKKRRKSRRDTLTQHRTSTSAFANASRIAIMNEKDLLKFLEELKRCSPNSDSPYAKIPIFPLFPNMDGTVLGKPFKDLQKLELLRKKEPLQFFEDYFFHKRNWKAQAASIKPLEDTCWPEEIINIDHIIKKKRQWNTAEAACIRQQVKKATDAYHLGVALGHRKDMLNFWRKIRGDLIGLETGNESFYDTFSTYTWSWNVCQELLSTKDLKLYDARANSHTKALFSSFPYITESDIELGRKRKRKRSLRGQTQ